MHLFKEADFAGADLRHGLVQVRILEVENLNSALLTLFLFCVDSVAESLREVHHFGRSMDLEVDGGALQVLFDQTFGELLSWGDDHVACGADVLRLDVFSVRGLEVAAEEGVRLPRPRSLIEVRVRLDSAVLVMLAELKSAVAIGIDVSLGRGVIFGRVVNALSDGAEVVGAPLLLVKFEGAA